MRRTSGERFSSAILVITLVALSSSALVAASDLELDPMFAQPPIPEIWEQADGEDARSGNRESWIWGPAILSATYEPYLESPGGKRKVYYFDKARMEINDPDEAWDSIWYATSGLLIREMILGEIQVGDHTTIDTRPAEIPVTGDLNDNPDSPTYATLALHTSIQADNGDAYAPDLVGEHVTAKLLADGRVDDNFEPPSGIQIANYDDVLGHNVPDVFWDWMNAQPIDWRYLVGHALTEAFWVDTRVAGAERVVLVQAFERRVLTYTPDNPNDWQVEVGNAGLHYRAWRGLEVPDDDALHALSYGIPYGEIISRAAERNGADAFVVAGVARTASGFDPLYELSDVRVGLMGIPVQLLEQFGIEHAFDPTINIHVAADLLALLYNEYGSWEEALERYFSDDNALEPLHDEQNELVAQTLEAIDDFRDEFQGQPSPFRDGLSSPQPPSIEVDEDGLYLVAIGEAAHYGKEAFPVERMEHILSLHASWGNAIEGWEYDPNGYYCVHPDFIPGERLHLTAPDGTTYWCTIGDSVGSADLDNWRSRWAVEVNWDLFEAMGVPYQQSIEVRAPAP